MLPPPPTLAHALNSVACSARIAATSTNQKHRPDLSTMHPLLSLNLAT